ncbi:LON peptidase substrate-binding domain-containing protein [Guyparkeria sp. SCN-R1]|uniref:LON peptidase substrate-binding domain-containing protein n=1 Tax=Guyparkeria sp. SCN-R1 TaxID=2341113 RepID=UPI001315A3AB|nr:LON peptidase substrate-binding domain-containing protein [Guyparkeria sp. SCN-R1]
MAAEERLGLFPLRTVLFPAGHLPLRLFEARYLDLLRECLRHDRPFGVVRIVAGSEVGMDEGPPAIAGVGTTARVVDTNVLPGGLLGVHVVGETRFRVLEHAPDVRGVVRARVEFLQDAPTSGDSIPADRRRPVLEALARLDADVLAAAGDEPDLVWLCRRLAERLPLDLAARQSLLERDDARAMLEWLDPWLADAD